MTGRSRLSLTVQKRKILHPVGSGKDENGKAAALMRHPLLLMEVMRKS
jgi:hypothetical protein